MQDWRDPALEDLRKCRGNAQGAPWVGGAPGALGVPGVRTEQQTHPSGGTAASGALRIAGSLATVTCPAHGSTFGLAEGNVMRGPATTPVDTYETRVVDGAVQIRERVAGPG